MRLPLDIMSKRFLQSVNICTGIRRLTMNYNCLRIAIESSDKSTNAMTSADNTEQAIPLDLYDVYETVTALLDMSASNIMRPS